MTLLLWIITLNSQHNGKIQKYDLGVAEIAAFPFGLDRPIILGAIKEDGYFQLNFTSLENLEIQNKSLWYSDIPETLLIECDQNSLILSDPSAEALTVKNLFIYQNKTIRGVVYGVTHEKLKDWIDELYYTSLTDGSFLSFLYVNKPTSLTGKCVIEHDTSPPIRESHFYNLVLTEGWNILKTSLSEIFTSREDFSIPRSQRIEAVKSIPSNIKWFYRKLE